MKFKLFPIFLLVPVFFFFTGNSPKEGDDKKEWLLAEAIRTKLLADHYQKKPIDDSFSGAAFDQFLKNLDYNKRFFTAEDINRMQPYRLKVDDEFKSGDFMLPDTAYKIFDERIKQAESITTEILAKPFELDRSETFETDPEKTTFAATEQELQDNWRKYLKYQTLVKLDELLEQHEKKKENKDSTYTEKSLTELEKEAREKVLKTQQTLFKRLNQMNATDKLSIYLNSIISTYDPHSTFFPPKAKENFDITISGKLEGIGATLTEKDGYIKVERIMPGSASWKQGELKAGDVILKVGQAEEEPVDIVNMRLDDAVQLIRGKKGTEVRLTVKKVDGEIKIIPITRDVVLIEETYAKSAVLKKDAPVGYIKLPQFYRDFNNRNGKSCARDVKAEIEKLKKDNISGLVLDLRNNGGGSLQDVVDIAGLFIKTGPVVQIRTSEGFLHVLKDEDPAVVYDGPLVILVNEFSASASEILAAAMQDYGRAVVIGSNATFGKGTVQNIVDLDELVPPSHSQYTPLGAMKLTIQKFYRINGGATQLKGVVPDIVLPDLYSYLELGEKEMDYAMPWDEIKPVSYSKTNSFKSISKIKKKSEKRISSSQYFTLLNENAKKLKENSEKSLVPLNLKDYRDQQKTLKEQNKKYENLAQEIPGLEVVCLKVEEKTLETDTVKASIAKDWYKDIRKDMYIGEALNVLQDIK